MFPLTDPDVQRRTVPFVTIALIALNAMVFLYELFLLGGFETTRFFYNWGLIPANFTQGLTEFGSVCDGQIIRTPLGSVCRGTILDLEAHNEVWVTVFSSMFIHGGFMHFAGNMVYLWVFGANIEDGLGHIKYLVFYLACGVAAAFAQVYVDSDSLVPMIGASGAVAGVLGAYIVMYPYNRITTIVFFALVFVIRVPALFLLGFWFFIQNVLPGLGSLVSSASNTGGVAFWAHIGGFVAGLLAMALYLGILGRRRPADLRRIPWRWSRS